MTHCLECAGGFVKREKDVETEYAPRTNCCIKLYVLLLP